MPCINEIVKFVHGLLDMHYVCLVNLLGISFPFSLLLLIPKEKKKSDLGPGV